MHADLDRRFGHARDFGSLFHRQSFQLGMNDWHTLFFRQLFKDVLKTLAAEREKKIKGQASELMDVLIARRSVDMMISPMT